MRNAVIIAIIILCLQGGRLLASPSADSISNDSLSQNEIPVWLQPEKEERELNYLKLSLFGATAATGIGIAISRMGDWWGHGYGPAHIKHNDWDDGLAQTDEISHLMIAYKLYQAGSGLSRWSGFSDKASWWIGGAISFGVMLWVEYPVDTHNPIQGFGYTDMAANVIGIAFGVTRDIRYDKLSFLDIKVSVKDFNQINDEVIAQTNAQNDAYIYWLTAQPSRDFPVHVSLGYSANHENEERLPEREIYLGFGTSLNEIAAMIDPKLRRKLDALSFYEVNFNFRIN